MMRWEDYLKKSLAENAEEAAAYLRLAVAEAGEDPAGLIAAFNQVTESRGGIDDLGLSVEERANLASTLSRSLAALALPRAA
jgi:DNA-binding phage protein